MRRTEALLSALDQHPHVDPGQVVENKRLGAMLATIQLAQAQRDVVRLASPKNTIRQKERLRAGSTVPTAAYVTLRFFLADLHGTLLAE